MTEKRPERSAQLKYVQVITDSVGDIPGRTDGYHGALRDCITEILALEAGNVQRRTNINQKVSAQVDSLGKFLLDNGWSEDGGSEE